ncbi:accessory Sec system protein Asp3 [Roseburia hominis]
MTGERWTIFWSEYSSDTYLYGSEISYNRKDEVVFRNKLMPPGTVIKQWYSKTNYQAQRIEPVLPMIDGEGRYRIRVDIDCPKGEAWLVRLVFFDKYGEEVGSVAVRDRIMNFRCPLKTYSYKMQLVNGGMTEFYFHSIEIWEIIDETEKKTEATE